MGADNAIESTWLRPLRLAPDMASLRLQVLAFVRLYITRWGEGPSYGEIAEATGTNRTRVKKVISRLIGQGLLLRTPGMRGLILPDQQDRALNLLRDLGWTIDPEGTRLAAPAHETVVTNPALHEDGVLHYDGSRLTVIRRDRNGTEEGKDIRDED